MEAAATNAKTVEFLRDRIRELQAAPRQYLAVLRTGVAELDALLPAGGLPLGQAVEMMGEPASGRTSMALRAVAAAHRENRLCAYVDGPGQLYPPAAAALGVDLAKLLIVRPRAHQQLAWSAVQLARSGAFACVVLDLTQANVRLSLAEGKKLADAAIKGGSLLLLLTTPEAPGEGMVRLRTRAEGLEGVSVEVLRSRGGGAGEHTLIPWASLYPREAPLYHYEQPGHLADLAEPSSQAEEVPAFKRVKASDIRNGVIGIHGQRPGRDVRMPPLGRSLGV
jgi:recombination protein RecA